jgi:hypothetical protein
VQDPWSGQNSGSGSRTHPRASQAPSRRPHRPGKVPDARKRSQLSTTSDGYLQSEFPVELATPEDVADAILASVNDETGQLRWVVGADQAERMHMRHETSEAEYNDWSWSQLGPSR